VHHAQAGNLDAAAKPRIMAGNAIEFFGLGP
jgi:hypothetical protein